MEEEEGEFRMGSGCGDFGGKYMMFARQLDNSDPNFAYLQREYSDNLNK